ncbi:hypothetical protein HYPSUDRAFT_39623 [Hypholoma sublateritium FD-334 SS-4]|uniref:Uncharacterized protein n=1 Tax=Hypholoma sublateritium (strain FD-334 SS-4) TaxID=945553 RepID=A0A0D2NYI8_HYPSF|nr:hypothetical protein HYPSUDRAFT_39623 [Hypholoma sublateritium FD-334 SS-4]
MNDWDDDIFESIEQSTPLSISPSSDMFTSPHSPPALPVTDVKTIGFADDPRTDRVKTVEEVNIDPPAKVVDPVALESFLPLLEALDCPGLKLINGAYHLRGPVPTDATRKLIEYARRVTKVTLGNTAPEAKIDAATWFRVLELRSRLSQSSTTFFPSLTEVCINGADSSLDQIFLLLSPSLESVDVCNVLQTRSDTLLTFLETVAEVAPGLSHIGVDTSLTFHDLQETYIKFSGLRSLRISVNGGSRFSYDTLLQIGKLPSLEALIIDASAAYYCAREERYSEPQAQLSPKAPNTILGGWGSSFSPSSSPTSDPSPIAFERIVSPAPYCHHSYIPSPGGDCVPSFPPPRAPSPTPSIPNIGDVVPTSPQQPALIGSGGDIAPLNQSINFQNLTKLHIKGQLKLMTELVQIVASTSVIDVALTQSLGAPSPIPIQKPTPKMRKKTKGSGKTAICDIIEEILSVWGRSLKSVYIAVDDTETISPPTIPSTLFKRLICISSLERLEMSGHTLDADFGDALHILTALPVDRRPKFKVIHLPIDAGDKGISFGRLRAIFECCPSIVSFQCGLKHLSNVPVLPDDGVTFGLQELGAGNPKAYGDLRRLAAAAQYLDALFPRLTVMKTQPDCNADEWEEIYDLVRMCQTSRSYHKDAYLWYSS